MEQTPQQPAAGALSWRLSSHPITLLTFLAFRICTLSSPKPIESQQETPRTRKKDGEKKRDSDRKNHKADATASL